LNYTRSVFNRRQDRCK